MLFVLQLYFCWTMDVNCFQLCSKLCVMLINSLQQLLNPLLFFKKKKGET